MAKKLLPDALWAEIAPLFPAAVARPAAGRPRVANREALLGILFVLYTGIPWERLPFEVAGCSGMTCWRRLRSWQDAGLWDQIHPHMLLRLGLAGETNWSRASVDASSVPAKKGAMRPARTPPTAASQAPGDTAWSTAQTCRSPLS
jgi:transposase